MATCSMKLVFSEDPYYKKFPVGLLSFIVFVRIALPHSTPTEIVEYTFNIGQGGGRTCPRGLGYGFHMSFRDAFNEFNSLVQDDAKSGFTSDDALRDVFGSNKKHLDIMRSIFSSPMDFSDLIRRVQENVDNVEK